MSPETIRRLFEINRRFYDERGDEFSRTRQSPWQGWSRVFDHLFRRAKGPALEVLDAGCGNGRFALALDAELRSRGLRAHYVGVDENPRLVGEARARLFSPGALHAMEAELLTGNLFAADFPTAESFHLVALMGVLHHVPSFRLRRHALEMLLDLVTNDGILAATLWRLDRHPRFAEKIVPWAEDQPADLEAGDVLLRFGDRKDSVRYCHFGSDEETERLVEGLGATLDVYDADGTTGDLNRYLILARQAR
jgi:SAM-dependent methyltransferase